MSNKLYYAIITPIFLLGFLFSYYFPATEPYALSILLIVGGWCSWKVFRKKLKNAKGEEEIRQVIVPVILSITLAMLCMVSFIF